MNSEDIMLDAFENALGSSGRRAMSKALAKAYAGQAHWQLSYFLQSLHNGLCPLGVAHGLMVRDFETASWRYDAYEHEPNEP